ncbi:sphinganine-1-phosphate aldolase [Phakopsora pachyrhizi]|uniref:sphinganine-1-phosphate aldolase n=1 Tax=Phakopsora pachyrhizi TaxID=170000 RepID=A0AAV0BQM2_PHAPC|nr:sphinganine-1-phosphate aldolase [Phakopsora pachyrhizi]CAH7689395.1 sphinganine-1-phosphate aldolase [Phakopsora pachyrhizi]
MVTKLQINRVLTNLLSLSGIKNLVFWYFIWSNFSSSLRHLRSRGVRNTFREIYIKAAAAAFRYLLLIPSIRKKVDVQLKQARVDLQKKIAPDRPGMMRWLELPSEGKSLDWLKSELKSLSDLPANEWKTGKVSGAIYHGGQEMEEVISTAFNQHIISNPLHPDVFPGVRKMEAEVVQMVLDLFNASKQGVGTTTSGGTESILMACKTYRDWAREVKGITEPEMVIPISAHAAFDKAGDYFGIKVHHIRVNEKTRKVDIARVKRAINSNTIMLVGSAPNFPDGAIDDITALGKLAKAYNLGLHVDCCLGSFLVPFIEKCGFRMEPFDFRVQGVTSISCDTHKYGFAPKGSSIIMYRTPLYRKYQYSVFTQWPGGVYASPAIAGSRSGAIIAGTWAALMYMGKEGYLESCRAIVGSAKRLAKTIKEEIPELEIMGDPLVSLVAFKDKKGSGLNIYELGDYLSDKGWHLNALQNPAALHIACTRLTLNSIDKLVEDLKEGVKSVIEKSKLDSSNQKDEKKGDMVTIYGLGKSSAVGPGLVGDLLKIYLDVLYSA